MTTTFLINILTEFAAGLPQDKFGIDDKAGVPYLHISFIIKSLLEETHMTKVYVPSDLLKRKDAKYIGSVPEDLRFSFAHLTLDSNRQCNCEDASLHLKAVYIDHTARVITKDTEDKQMSDLLCENELCNPGYTLLCPFNVSVWKKKLYYINEAKPVLRSDYFGFVAFTCAGWPELTLEWVSRKRPSGWPNKEQIEMIMCSECLVIPISHSQSPLPECEWQFIFPDAEKILAKSCLSEKQKYCFRVFKGLVDFYLRNGPVRLSTTHLKTVMYFACEVIPLSCWSQNIGGCVLYLLERLGKCLSEKSLPNYFIKENNMIDHFTTEQIAWAREKLLILRLYPVISITHFADHHSFDVERVNSTIADIEIYEKDQDANRAIHNVFVPALVTAAINLAKTNYYKKASTLFLDAYNQMLEAPRVSGYVQVDDEMSSFQRFLMEVLSKQADEYSRNHLSYIFDTYCGTQFGYQNEMKTLGSIMGEEAGSYSDYPVTCKADDTLSQVQYIDDTAYSLFVQCKFEDCARFLRCAIEKAKSGLQNMDSYPTDANNVYISRGLTNKNYLGWNGLLEAVWGCLIHLYQCYKCLSMPILFQEYIHDFEDVTYKCHCKAKLHYLADIWDDLGNSERAQDIRRKIPDHL